MVERKAGKHDKKKSKIKYMIYSRTRGVLKISVARKERFVEAGVADFLYLK